MKSHPMCNCHCRRDAGADGRFSMRPRPHPRQSRRRGHLGSYLGKKILDRLPERLFILLIETTLLVAGIGFLIHG